MPPTKLPASDSRRPLSRAEPDIEIGFVPFPHCAAAAPIESLRGGGALKTPRPPLALCDMLPARSPTPAFCNADVRLEACWPGGETEVVCRVEMSIGAAPAMVEGLYADDLKFKGTKKKKRKGEVVDTGRRAYVLFCSDFF